jgi:hypothetical protein
MFCADAASTQKQSSSDAGGFEIPMGGVLGGSRFDTMSDYTEYATYTCRQCGGQYEVYPADFGDQSWCADCVRKLVNKQQAKTSLILRMLKNNQKPQHVVAIPKSDHNFDDISTPSGEK